jgi:hypothetical protein
MARFNKAADESSTAKQTPHRPMATQALALRAEDAN